jgi:GT2 family glycosyltransferase
MNKELTIIFSSYQSQHLLNKLLKQLHKKFKVIIIENSLDINIKKKLEKNFKGVEVIIPEENLGLAKSYKLGIDHSKTKFVFLNNPDIEITNKSIKDLLDCAKKIKNLGIISPIYKNEKIYKNYENNSLKKRNYSTIFKKFDIQEVDWIDNNFLIKNNKINKNLFDKNYFLYFETVDFAVNLKKSGKKIYVAKKIKFHHHGSSSLPASYNNLAIKTRAFHYNWSKFYYFKKNYSYFYALRKILPNLIKGLKKIIFSIIRLDVANIKLGLLELYGIITAVSNLGSFFRPKN